MKSFISIAALAIMAATTYALPQPQVDLTTLDAAIEAAALASCPAMPDCGPGYDTDLQCKDTNGCPICCDFSAYGSKKQSIYR